MNKRAVVSILLAAGLVSAGRAVAETPPEFEHGCEYGQYSHVFHAVENKAIEIEDRMFSLYLTPERAVWEEQPDYRIDRACVQLACDEQTDEWVWLFPEGGSDILVVTDESCRVDLVTLNISEEYNVYLPIILR